MNNNFLFVTTYTESFLEFRLPLVKYLQSIGYRIYLASPTPNHEYTTRLKLENIQHLPISVNRNSISILSDLSFVRQLIKIFHEHKFSIVLTYFAKAVVFGTFVAFLFRVQSKICLIEGLGYFFTKPSCDTEPPFSIFLNFLYKCTFALADKIIFLNDDDSSYLIKLKISPRKKSFVLGPIGVDLNKFHNQKQLDLSSISFVFVGRFLKNKGIREFVNASCIASKVLQNASFNIAGSVDDGIDAIPKSSIIKWEKECPINFLGYMNTIDLLHSMTVLVLPSYREGFSRIIQEAMSFSIPVIASNVPGCRQAIISGYNGILVPPYDADKLASAMVYLARNPSEIKSMSNNARDFALVNFSENQQNLYLLSLVTSIPVVQ